MVKDFYNSGFNESSADDKPEMSQEELRFLCKLERTVVLRDGHYKMELPLKDRKEPVLNSKLQAEKRTFWWKESTTLQGLVQRLQVFHGRHYWQGLHPQGSSKSPGVQHGHPSS